jgi:shikimate dehydrogenase
MTDKPDDKDIRRACVMGYPISHSLSPKLHGHWLKKYGIKGAYTTMSVAPDHLKDALALIKKRGFAGCNLTVPLKELAMPLINDHDESCLYSGAANTIVFENGTIRGFNSDGFGFMESLKTQLPKWNGDRVVILGTGGASRGIIVSLRAAGAKKFVLVNRTPAKAEKVAKQFTLDAEILPWDRRAAALDGATLLVNCTSLGMKDHAPLDLSLDRLPKEAGVADIVYRPLITPLLKSAKMRGNRIAEGLPMLLHQGRLGFHYWFGRDPEVTKELYDEIAAAAVG